MFHRQHHLRILHLSDLHARGERETQWFARHRVLGPQWQDNLNQLCEEGPIDIVCFTGDVADWGRNDEYAIGTDFLQQLMSRLGLAMNRLFIVPGNHDVDRSVAPAQWKRLRENSGRVDYSHLSKWIRGVSGPPFGFTDGDRDEVLQRTAAFHAWLATLGCHHLLPNASPHGRLGFRAELTLADRSFSIFVVGLNSAWLCGGDDDSERLALTTDQTGLLTTTADGKPLAGFRLGLLHHPLSYYWDEPMCRPHLSDGLDLLLRGHTHQERFNSTIDPDRTIHVLAAGSLYDGDQGDRWPNAHHLIDARLDSKGRSISYEVRFRAWSPDSSFWFDNSSLYRAARSGRLRIDLMPRIPARVKSHYEEKLLRIPPFKEALENGMDIDELAARIARESFPTVLRHIYELGYTKYDPENEGFWNMVADYHIDDAYSALSNDLQLLFRQRD